MIETFSESSKAEVDRKETIGRNFLNANEGATLVIWALAAPLLLGLAGAAIEYTMALRSQNAMQLAADAGALAGAKELSLADAKQENLQAVVDAVVQKYVHASKTIASLKASVETNVNENPLQVQVAVRATAPTYFGSIYGLGKTDLSVVATASIAGQPNICVLALDPSEAGALSLEGRSKLTGNNCAVFSNSTSTAGLSVRDAASIGASTVCSSGGVAGNGSIAPPPFLDCPQFEDPLASRPEPDVGRCDHTARIIAFGNVELEPGVYCLGLTISGLARVTFKPGVYVIKDGPFAVTAAAQIAGDSVGFHLSGASFFVFDPLTRIALSAPTSGPLAGLLFFGSRTQSPLLQNVILSSNAHKMVGTIYLPNASLIVDELAEIGSKSAYTAIVARRLMLLLGPNLVLNADYDQTDVPVPDGIKNVGGRIRLVK